VVVFRSQEVVREQNRLGDSGVTLLLLNFCFIINLFIIVSFSAVRIYWLAHVDTTVKVLVS